MKKNSTASTITKQGDEYGKKSCGNDPNDLNKFVTTLANAAKQIKQV